MPPYVATCEMVFSNNPFDPDINVQTSQKNFGTIGFVPNLYEENW